MGTVDSKVKKNSENSVSNISKTGVNMSTQY